MRNPMTAEEAETLISLKLSAHDVAVNRGENGTITATTPWARSLSIVSLLPQEGRGTRFVLPDIRDSNHRFIVCTEQDETGTPVQWVFPEIAFVVRSEIKDTGMAELDLDLSRVELDEQTIREALPFFIERWDPIVQFDDFLEYMPPSDHLEFADRWELLEDILELIWFKENREPGEVFVPIGEFPDQDGKLQLRVSAEVVDFISQVPDEERTELLDGMSSIIEDPFQPDTLGIAGTPGNYRVVKPERD